VAWLSARPSIFYDPIQGYVVQASSRALLQPPRHRYDSRFLLSFVGPRTRRLPQAGSLFRFAVFNMALSCFNAQSMPPHGAGRSVPLPAHPDLRAGHGPGPLVGFWVCPKFDVCLALASGPLYTDP